MTIVNSYSKISIIWQLSFAFDDGLRAISEARALMEIASDVREY